MSSPTTSSPDPSELPRQSLEDRWNNALGLLRNGSAPDDPSPTSTLVDASQTAWAWGMATKHLGLRHLEDKSPRIDIAKATLLSVYARLHEAGLMQNLLTWFLEMMYNSRHMIVDDVADRFKEWESGKDWNVAYELVTRLYHWKIEWYRETGAFTHHGVDSYWPFKRTFRTIILSSLPPSFTDVLRAVLRKTFAETEKSANRLALANALDQMGILGDFKSLINTSINQEIHDEIARRCPGQWNEHQIHRIREWFNKTVRPWMIDIFGKDSREELMSAFRKFEHQSLKALCDLRISELFDIIVAYTDATHPLPVLQDLKDCLARIGQRAELTQSLRQANQKRLLHPGASTSDILMQYVCTIKVLRFLDPPGVLLFGVAEPIRRYLRGRPDTIKTIVANLIGDHDNEEEEGISLFDGSDPKPIVATEETHEDYSDLNWQPAPNDAEPGFRAQKENDIISTLVSIYGEKEVFIKELQVLFAQRLLAISDSVYDNEGRNLEMLRVRFGETSLQGCDVMMKDMNDSRRTDQQIQSDIESPLHPSIISRMFWPPLPSISLQLPGQFKTLQDEYEEKFSHYKPDKKLRWIPHMGTVVITLEFDECDVSFTVSPLQAAIMELFSEKEKWGVDELADKLGKVEGTLVINALLYWLDQGVVEDLGGRKYRLLELTNAGAPRTALPHALVETPSSAAGDQVTRQEFEVIWNFARGVLTNLGALPTTRIHSMLKFAGVPNLPPVNELTALLAAAEREGLVDLRDGLWTVKK